MRRKGSVLCKSLLWGIVVLLFPVASGVFSVIFSLNTVQTLFLQGFFMLMALIPPAFLVFSGKWRWNAVGFAQFDLARCKRCLFFIPVLVIFIPAAVRGFYIKSTGHVLGSLFLYLSVGVSEEVYFRGVIPHYLKKEFPLKQTVLFSTLIFGVGHIATALTGSGTLETALTVLNAFLFGWLAMEMTLLAGNILPAVLVHFLFDFETKITVMTGGELLIAEVVRGALMLAAAIWLAAVISGRKDTITRGD